MIFSVLSTQHQHRKNHITVDYIGIEGTRFCSEISLKANFHSGKLSVDWNGQENFSLSCELWVGTNDFKTQRKIFLSVPIHG